MREGWQDHTPEPDTDPHVQAKQFFGFDPLEDVDPILLRSRKFAREKRARTDEEREEIERHFEILGGKVNKKPAPPPPAPPAPPPSPPRAAPEVPVIKPRVKKKVEKKAPPLPVTWDELAPAELSSDESQRRNRLSSQIDSLAQRVNTLRTAPVIDCTVGLMNQIRGGVLGINNTLGSEPKFVSNEQRDELLELLGHLATRSIVGSIYWGEYPSVIHPLIEAKKEIYRKLRSEVPPGHGHLTRPDNAHGYIQ